MSSAPLAAIAIPFVLFLDAKSNRTLDVMNNLDFRVAEIIDKKRELDEAKKEDDTSRFSPEYIDAVGNEAVQSQVFRLLNLYEGICTGGEEGRFSLDIIEEMRGDALRETWKDYDEYIVAHRKKPGEEHLRAWGVQRHCQPTDPKGRVGTNNRSTPRTEKHMQACKTAESGGTESGSRRRQMTDAYPHQWPAAQPRTPQHSLRWSPFKTAQANGGRAAMRPIPAISSMVASRKRPLCWTLPMVPIQPQRSQSALRS